MILMDCSVSDREHGIVFHDYQLYISCYVGFEVSSQNVLGREPEAGDTTTVQLEIKRNGGHIGQSVVSWNLNANEGVESDIQPTHGTETFPSGVTVATIELSVMADDIPEIDEVRTSISYMYNTSRALYIRLDYHCDVTNSY